MKPLRSLFEALVRVRYDAFGSAAPSSTGETPEAAG